MSVIDLFKLHGRVALVTGGAGIYGVHITSALAEAGARVVIGSRNIERCQQLAEKLRGLGLEVTAAQLDLGSKDSIQALRDWIVGHFGRLDILFNNAVVRSGSDMGTTTEEEWEETMKVNSTDHFLSCKSFGEQRGLGNS